MKLGSELFALIAAGEPLFDDGPVEGQTTRIGVPPASGAPVALPLLLSPEQAAGVLGCALQAFYARARRGQVKGVVRTGRKVEVQRDVLLESPERSARRGR